MPLEKQNVPFKWYNEQLEEKVKQCIKALKTHGNESIEFNRVHTDYLQFKQLHTPIKQMRGDLQTALKDKRDNNISKEILIKKYFLSKSQIKKL
jgi:pyruvate-formate lyase-activating enzyme